MSDIRELEEGSVIGNYRVVWLLGQGGIGAVYEVEHLELGTHCVLKTFTFDLGYEEGSRMPYFVMDLVTYEDGETYTVEDIDPK